MANYAKKNQKNGSFIFTCILVVLLIAGIFGVFYSYRSNHSTIIDSKELAASLSVAFNKPAGKITAEDLASVEGINVFELGGYGVSAVMMLDGYKEAYEAYNKEGLTDEEKSALVNPATLQLNAQFTNSNALFEEIDIFTGLKTILAQNYTGITNETDVLSIVADKFPELEEFVSYGYAINDFSKVGSLTKLTTLGVGSSPLTDISAISNLKNLEILDLSNTGISDISALSSLDNEKVKSVYLDGNNITDWSPVAHLDEAKVIKTAENAESKTEESDEVTVDENSSEVTNETTEAE